MSVKKVVNFLSAPQTCVDCVGTGERIKLSRYDYGRCSTCYGSGRTQESYERLLPATRIVCPYCDGEGTELRGGLKGAVMDPQTFAEDPDLAMRYFGGAYDVRCSYCDGRNVVDEIVEADIWDLLTVEEREDYRRYEDQRAAARAEAYYERRAIGYVD